MFKRYSSIENHYQNKELMRWLSEFPELENEEFILEEKIDGANIQVYASPDGEVKVGKRSGFIGRDENFFGLWDLLDGEYKELMSLLSIISKDIGNSIRLFGEIYGPGIQKRIKYNVEKPSLVFFDMMVGDEFIAPKVFHEFSEAYGLLKSIS